MAVHELLACCIRGCPRTVPAELRRLAEGAPVICGRHFRCDPLATETLRRARLLHKRGARALARRYEAGQITAEYADRVYTRLGASVAVAWGVLVETAQELQDAGCFEPRKPGRLRAGEERLAVVPTFEKALEAQFETMFATLKSRGK